MYDEHLIFQNLFLCETAFKPCFTRWPVNDPLRGHSWAQSCSDQSYLTHERANFKCSIAGLTIEHVIGIFI